jgi:apolipoprotein N-acyltransferase
MKQELLQPAATITAALIHSTSDSVHQTTIAEVAKMFAAVYREMEDALKMIQTAELKVPGAAPP